MHVRRYVRQVTPQSLDDIAPRCQRPRRRPVYNPTVVMPDLDRHASELDRAMQPNLDAYRIWATVGRAVTAEQFHAWLWPNNATRLTQNRLALVGEESVSVGHRPLIG
jgi:hypothetical protein